MSSSQAPRVRALARAAEVCERAKARLASADKTMERGGALLSRAFRTLFDSEGAKSAK